MMPERDRNDVKRVRRIEKTLGTRRVRTGLGGTSKKGLAESDQLVMFREIRKYIEHEDQIINSRTTWFMTLNSFLFGGFSVISVGLMRTDANDTEKQLQAIIVILFAVIGIALAATTNLSVRAAYSSIRKLRIFWCTHYEPIDFEKAPIPYFPHIIGGGPNEKVALKGRILSLWMPFWTGAAWMIIGFGASLRLVFVSFTVSLRPDEIVGMFSVLAGCSYLAMLFLIERSKPNDDD